ncbi:hypothetical protein JD276_03795 [Leucobacter sp. CSA1]|uniref:PH domain-containing protein n=1 Tax=Leucobacter chromiisoli TaxID=2796471 RepID=A0A934Q691_9MICO|nr:hypothetical protein [Leucobacter chromiisoli]MBK0418150.1 hypothetical protein [Leucobacter chromiisoli]
MSKYALALIFGALVIPLFAAMWFAWRARARRDAGVGTAGEAPRGELLAEFPRVGYVSTTPVGEPLVRVAVRGLRYRGPASLSVRRDGVSIAVAGEEPVHLGRGQLRGAGSARARVGKAVERDGLALLRWESLAPAGPGTAASRGAAAGSEPRSLESSFRFADPAEHRAFEEAIAEIVPGDGAAAADRTQTNEHTTQEDA